MYRMANDVRTTRNSWIVPALAMIGGALFFGSFLGFVFFSLFPHVL